MSITKLQLLEVVKIFLKEIEACKPKNKSLEWYLANNLKQYLKKIKCCMFYSLLLVMPIIFQFN